jgi:serine/threonine protein kinase
MAIIRRSDSLHAVFYRGIAIYVLLCLGCYLMWPSELVDHPYSGTPMIKNCIPDVIPKPRVFYLQNYPFTRETKHKRKKHKRKISNYGASDDEEWMLYLRDPEPYVDQSMCVPMQAWQRIIHPSCNMFHEVDIVFDDVEFLDKGGWRIAWKLDDSFILKTLKWENQNFDALTFERHNIDAIISEHLTSSQFVMDIYGFCGQSVLNEFAQGSLTAKVGDRGDYPLTAFQKLRLSLDIAIGIANLHDISGNKIASIVHNDLKPNNIVLVNGRAKLNDFNDGELLQWNQTSQSQCGFRRNPVENWARYRAPEQAREGELLSEKVDVFALGSMLVYILTGRYPFDGESMTTTKQKLKENIAPTLSSVYRNSDDPAVLAIVEAIDECHEPVMAKRSSAEEVSFRLRTRFEGLFGK